MRGAGGTEGGVGRFFIGLFMMCGGFYLLLSAITVYSGFYLGMNLFHAQVFGMGMGMTCGTVLLPFILGVAMVFWNARSVFGWVLMLGSLAALIFGVINSIHFGLRTMSLFELLTILILAFGGLALFLSSLRSR